MSETKALADKLWLAEFALGEEKSHCRAARYEAELLRDCLQKVFDYPGIPGDLRKMVEEMLNKEDREFIVYENTEAEK